MMSPARSKPPVRAFVSYSSHDATLAELLRSTVAKDGISSFYAPVDIKDREIWRPRLESEARAADVILLLYADSAGESVEFYKEIELAPSLGACPSIPQLRGFKENRTGT
jgi:hypothetical protein